MVTVGCVLMAAGFGRRFGSDKLLAEVEGAPLYRRAMTALSPALFTRATVVARHREILDAGAAAGFLPLDNRQAAEGVSATIRLGLSALTDLDGVLFAVCDQPWLRRESVERLIAAFRARPDRIAALGWQGARGNPVVFPRDLYSELLALMGDTGGGRVIAAHAQRLLLVEAGQARELLDVDRADGLVRGAD